MARPTQCAVFVTLSPNELQYIDNEVQKHPESSRSNEVRRIIRQYFGISD